VVGTTRAETPAAEAVAEPAEARAASLEAALAPGPGRMLALQRLAGNRAARAAVGRPGGFSVPPPLTVIRRDDAAQRSLAAAVRARGPDRATVARCAGPACRCQGFNRDPGRVTLAEIPIGDPSLMRMLQREPAWEEVNESAASSDPKPVQASVVTDRTNLKPAIEVNDADGRAIVAEAIRKLGSVPGARTFPFEEAVAANEPPAGEQSIATWPAGRQMIQRSILHMLEGGFVGSLQLCYDFCKGELSVVGWIWAGVGIVTPGWFGGKKFRGAYVFAEKEFGKWGFEDLKLACGTCPTECKKGEHDSPWGFGGANFPINLKPGEKKKLRKAGLEVGLLVTPHSLCDADIEVIALIDLTKYLGPVGAAVSAASETISSWSQKYGVEIECGIGVDISGAIHVCRDGLALKADSAKVCGGGYVGCGIGLAHEKTALPGI
jgi:hypothetical protein